MNYFYIIALLCFCQFTYSFKTHTPFLFLAKQNFHNKKIITLSPGGFRGFYVLGICKFIKENYDLSNYVFSGASAGAWNSLYLSYNGYCDKFINSIMDIDIKNQKNLGVIQKNIKETLLELLDEEDFDFSKLYIGTTIIKRFQFRPIIYSEFKDLEDAINCCIASSHIPFITGGFRYRYRGLSTYDGGFASFPYLNNEYSSIHITPSIWEIEEPIVQKVKKRKKKISDYSSLINKNGFDIKELYLNGYNDVKKNKDRLDIMFEKI